MGRSRWPMGLRLRNLRIGPKLALLSLVPTMAFLVYVSPTPSPNARRSPLFAITRTSSTSASK